MAVESVPVTVEVLTKALQNVEPSWYSTGPVLALFGVLVGALIGFGGNWYLKRMDREAWLQQRRWELKWECYSHVAEHLGELYTLISEAVGVANLIANNERGGEALRNDLSRRMDAARERFESFRRYASVARIVVPPEVCTFLTAFGDRWNAASGDPVAQGNAARDAWMGILDHARVDLRFEKSEIPAEEGQA